MPLLPIRFSTHFSFLEVPFCSTGAHELFVTHSLGCVMHILILIVSKARCVHFCRGERSEGTS